VSLRSKSISSFAASSNCPRHTEGTSPPPLCPACPSRRVVASVKAASGGVHDVAACSDVGVDCIVVTFFRVITTITVSVISCNSRHDLGMPRLSFERIWSECL